jgi:hypothetical protein
MNCDLCLPWFEIPDESMRKAYLPSLDCLLRYAHKTDDVYLPELVSRNLPYAAFQRLGMGMVNDHDWLCATPMYLQIGIEKIYAYPLQNPLSRSDAEALIIYLNQHFSQDQIAFEYGDEQHWFISYPKSKAPVTTPVHQVMGQSIYPLLPGGDHEAFWVRFLNELQMLLHQAPVNQKREELGMEPLSTFWPWGEGELITAGSVQQVKVISDDLHGIGLSRLMDAELLTLEQLRPELFQLDGDRIIVYSDSGSEEHDPVEFLEASVFKPLLSAWKKGDLKKLNLGLADETFKLGPRRFWQGLVRC